MIWDTKNITCAVVLYMTGTCDIYFLTLKKAWFLSSIFQALVIFLPFFPVQSDTKISHVLQMWYSVSWNLGGKAWKVRWPGDLPRMWYDRIPHLRASPRQACLLWAQLPIWSENIPRICHKSLGPKLGLRVAAHVIFLIYSWYSHLANVTSPKVTVEVLMKCPHCYYTHYWSYLSMSPKKEASSAGKPPPKSRAKHGLLQRAII